MTPDAARACAGAGPRRTPGPTCALRPLALWLALSTPLASACGAPGGGAATPPAVTPPPTLSAGGTPDASGAPTGTAARALPPPKIPAEFSVRPTSVAEGERGMVATDAPLATRIGADTLRRGGNAIDAAVAAAFALAVVYPQAGNLGGGGFLVLHKAGGEAAALDFRETAPKAASRDMYLDKKGALTERSRIGHLAAGVPGSVAGLWEAHRAHGALPWKEVVAPAATLAEQGFEVDGELARVVAERTKELARFPASAALFLPGGKPLAAGSTFKLPELGATLRRIAEGGPSGFYEGETARRIVEEMKRGKGIITHDDLRGYRAVWRPPVAFEYRGHRVLSMPPPSSGGLVIALTLDVLEGYDFASLGFGSTRALHLQAEAMRRTFALRNELLGDPDFVRVPTERFLGPEAATAIRATIREDRATQSAEVLATPPVARAEGANTTHLGVVDAAGNAVALTTTVNDLFGSSVTVAGAGFVLNNEMDDFAAAPGKPNLFGLVQGETNAIAPGKRMLSSMSPTIVLGADGRPLLVTGAAGGPTIISAVIQIVSNVLDHRMEPAAAVAAPRMHHQHLPDVLMHEEGGVEARVAEELVALGHKLAVRKRIADAPTLARGGRGFLGIGEPRREGSVALGP